MTCDEILKEHKQIRYSRAIKRLYDLGDTLFGEGQWGFINKYDSDTSTDIKGNCNGTKIGDLMLTDGCKHNKCSKAGYIYVVKDMFHEARHIQRYVIEWNTSSDDDKLSEDIIRRKLISFYYPSAYTNNYTNDPGEMDAEAYAIKKSLEYFESDPLISEEEARTILFEFMMSEDYYNSDMFKGHDPRSIDDILHILEERRDTVADILYKITDKITPGFEDCVDSQTDMTRKFLYSPKFEAYRKAAEMCTTGTIKDKVMEQTLFLKEPDIDKYVKRLESELSDRKAQMQDKMRAAYLGLTEDEAVQPDEIDTATDDEEFANGIRALSNIEHVFRTR